jgi:hypothetical protein
MHTGKKLIRVNTDQQVNVYIVSTAQIAGRRRVQIPFDPIVDSGIIKYITYYPNQDYNINGMKYKAMYSYSVNENGTILYTPNDTGNLIMLTLASKDGGYLFYDMPLNYFIPSWGGNYRIPCFYRVDFDKSFIRYFGDVTVPGLLPLIIPLFFTMWPQNGKDNR